MATTWIKPIRAEKGKSAAATIQDSLKYIMNPSKTRNGELISTYACDKRTAATEFIMSKQEYSANTGRVPRNKDVLMYHMRISFKPGEIPPDEATKVGNDLAMRWTKGKHSYAVATHEDKEHIHCHIMFNSVNIEATRKYINFWLSSIALRRLSDIICLENGLSVIENPKPSRDSYGDWLDKKEPTQREKLEQLIDEILEKKPSDFDEFIKLLKEAKCEIKQGKHLSLRADGQKRFIRLRSLSDDYSETAIRERISGKRTAPPKKEATTTNAPTQNPRKFSLLIDVQNSIKAQNSPGYERWAKLFSLKQAAKTLMFLQDNNLDEWEKLSEAAQQAKDDFNAIQTRIQAADSRMKEVTVLQKHIGTYVKTKDIYAEYKRRKFSKKFLAENEKPISDHKAAKAYFDELKLEKLPTIGTLKQEYATLAAEKKKLYSDHHAAKNHMQEILMAKQNVEMLLNYHATEQTKTADRGER